MKVNDVVAAELAQPQYNEPNEWTFEFYTLQSKLVWAKHCGHFAIFDIVFCAYRCSVCSSQLSEELFMQKAGKFYGQ